MNKKVKALIKKAEDMGWFVRQEDGNVYDFGKYSPAGQDFHISIDTENDADLFVENIFERYYNFDCSYETYIWLDNTGHGINGSPYDMKNLYEDMEACEEMILELHNELKSML